MTAEDALFDDPNASKIVASPTGTGAASDHQVAQLRAALDARGMSSMEERRQAIVNFAGRQVASLRELSFAEARRILDTMAMQRPKSTGGSAWDDRDGETWIDKL